MTHLGFLVPRIGLLPDFSWGYDPLNELRWICNAIQHGQDSSLLGLKSSFTSLYTHIVVPMHPTLEIDRQLSLKHHQLGFVVTDRLDWILKTRTFQALDRHVALPYDWAGASMGENRESTLQFGRFARFLIGKSPRDVDRAIRFIVRDAAQNVPYYRNAFAQAKIDPKDVRGVSDLVRLPIATKGALLTAAEGGWMRQGVNWSRCFRTSTSGTTGMILTIRMTRPEMYFRRISLVLAMTKGIRLRLPLKIIDVGAPPVKRQGDLAQRLNLVRVIFVPIEESLSSQIQVLQGTKVAIVQGQPSLLKLLAEELQQRGVTDISCDQVTTTGEVLHQPVRELLERTFSAKVRDLYNCDEVGNMAWECPDHSGVMHVNTDTCCFEIVDQQGSRSEAGCEGRVLVTSLYNLAMPFIRYATGDRAEMCPPQRDRCSCGYRGSSIRLIGGRDEDYLILADGRWVSPRIPFRMVWDQLPVTAFENRVHEIVRSFQLIQETYDRFTLRVSPGPHYEPTVWDGLEAKLQTLHKNVKLSVELDESLSISCGLGKFSAVVSRVPRSSTPSE